jgi:Site-specific recombinase XerD
MFAHENTREAVTLAGFYASVRDLVSEGLTSNAVAAYDRAWKIRLAPTLGGRALDDLRPLVIASARANWSGSASTKQDALALLSRVLELAVMDGRLAANPCRSLPHVRGKVTDPDPVARALSDVQVARMLELTAFHPYGQRALAGLANTGLRLGELVGLRWEDVDLERGIITVRRTFSPDGSGRLVLRPTKSGRIRSVPILDPLLPILDEARTLGFPHIFTGSRGGPFDSGNLARMVTWHAIRDQIATFSDGVGLRFHDLRHTYLTRLARLGIAPAKLQLVAGHASITTTELYTRSSAVDAALDVRERVNSASREVTPGGGEAALDRRKDRP